MLRVYLTGRVMIEAPDLVIEAADLPGRQGRLAFVFLATDARRVDRFRLAEVLWPDGPPDAWEASISAVVSKLRRVLDRAGLDGSRALAASDGSYELRFPAGTWIDLRVAVNALDRAEGSLRRGDARAAWSDATVASTVFRRSFLAGETGAWVERVRRDLHEWEIRTFDVLARVWLIEGNPTAALTAARRLVDLAPYRESAHARVMECHLAAGNRAEAIRVYGDLRRMLEESMGISPGPQTESLYEQALG